ncbi:unnamed protein product [Plutella xylostella]|uniref:(diamondback moth) hypothetical protein n=1 Tax=Plutella xylostella TaxID=51655 RepID=A0A8S4FZB4_PLUXY|nr:unnamed protein product [Plutella xylostella]
MFYLRHLCDTARFPDWPIPEPSHIAARYPYLAIPAVNYPQLQSELFCNMFYLRHLCDTARFPDWPIPEPVAVVVAHIQDM